MEEQREWKNNGRRDDPPAAGQPRIQWRVALQWPGRSGALQQLQDAVGGDVAPLTAFAHCATEAGGPKLLKREGPDHEAGVGHGFQAASGGAAAGGRVVSGVGVHRCGAFAWGEEAFQFVGFRHHGEEGFEVSWETDPDALVEELLCEDVPLSTDEGG